VRDDRIDEVTVVAIEAVSLCISTPSISILGALNRWRRRDEWAVHVELSVCISEVRVVESKLDTFTGSHGFSYDLSHDLEFGGVG
jgi:hypothetical protein